MPIIEIPDVGDVEFPDSMSPQELNTAAARVYAQRMPGYEQQVKDLGLNPEAMAREQARIDKRSDLLAQQAEARRQGQYWEGVAQRIDNLTGAVVEPLTRPVSGAVGRAADVFIPGAPVAEPLLQQPGINLPRAGEATTEPGKVAAGAYNAVADLLAGLTTPDAVALLPAAANKTVLTAWIAQMAGHAPQRVLNATERFKAGDTQGGVQEVTAGLAELGMAELGRRHVMGGERLTAADIEGMPRVLPVSPDTVARNLAAPGTVRPTEQRAMASPLEGRQPAEVFLERTPIRNPAGEVVDVKVTPRIRQIVIEDPQLIEPVTRFVKPDVEGGMLPERRQGFQRTAEDFIQLREGEMRVESPEPTATVTQPSTQKLPADLKEVMDSGKIQEEGRQTLLEQRPAQTIEAPKVSGVETAAGERSKAAPEIAAPATPAPETVKQKSAKGKKAEIKSNESTTSQTVGDVSAGNESPRQRQLDGLRQQAQALDAEIKASKHGTLAQQKRIEKWMELTGQIARLETGQSASPEPPLQSVKKVTDVKDAENYAGKLSGEAERAVQQWARHVEDVVNPLKEEIRRIQAEVGQMEYDAKRTLPDAKAKTKLTQKKFFETYGVKSKEEANALYKQKNAKWKDLLDKLEAAEQTRRELEATKERRNKEWSNAATRAGELRRQVYPKVREGDVGIVSGTKAEAWADRTIAESRKRVNTGIDPELMAAYVTKGVALLERGTRDFAAWARKMIAEHGDPVRPHLRTLFEQSQRTLQQLTVDGRKMRSVSKRGAASDQLPAESRAKLGVDPESFYQQQNVRTVQDAVAQMSNAELRQPLNLREQADSQNYVARQLELARRLMAEPATRAEGYEIFQGLAREGTAMGQLINQFKLLRNATPDGLLNVINGMLSRRNAPPLTPEQRVQLRVLAGRNIQDISAWRAAEERWAANPTRSNLKAVLEAQATAENSGRVFNERVQRIVPRGFWDTATAMMMGNKLSILSQERNVVANVALMPLKMAARLPAATIDMIDAMIRNKPREVALSGLKGFAGTLQGAASAVPEAVRTMWRGSVTEGLGRGESNVNLRPLVALKEALTGELMRNKPLAQKLALMAEASPPAYFAAGYLRGLAALDLPSRQAAFGRLVAEQMTLDYKNARSVVRALERKGQARTADENVVLAQMRAVPKPTVQLIRDATRAPELFVKPEALARIRKEALGAVFQDPNAFTRAVLGIERTVPDPVRFMIRAVVPFVSTPVNIAGKMFAYSPAGFLTHVARHAIKGDSRAAKIAAGDAIVGSLIWGAGLYLWDKGLISPPLDAGDEQQKMRMLQGELMPANQLNVSGLQRLFDGGDPAWRPGDKTVDFTYYGSLAGAQLQVIAAIKRQQEKNPAPETDAAAVAQWLNGSVQGAGGYLVNQTFMQGTRDLLDAFRSERKFDEFLARYSMSIADTVMPRQLESVNKAVREYQREVKDDALDQRIQNQLVNRLGVFTQADEALPFKRDVWGRPLRETPEGSNPWVYQLFDVGKARQIPDDPLKLEVYNLARRTADARAIPTPPDASLTMLGKTYRLTPAQLSDLQEQVGTLRYELAAKVITPRFLSLNDEQKLAVLERAWSAGSQFGNVRFFMKHRGELKEQPKPMGRR